MREVILDTETTGLSPNHGHRIISLAAVELVDFQPTGRFLHYYLNPDRESDPGALKIHGLTTAFLADKPRFRDVADELLTFLAGDALVIHNAPFDLDFLHAEIGLTGRRRTSLPSTCTLDIARQQRGFKAGNKLDNLVADYGIANLREATGHHGALIDALLLVPVYQRLRGRPVIEWTRDWLVHFGVMDESGGSQEGKDSLETAQPVVAGTETGEGGTGSQEVAVGDDQVSNSSQNGSADGRRAAQGTADGDSEQPAAIIEFVVVAEDLVARKKLLNDLTAHIEATEGFAQ